MKIFNSQILQEIDQATCEVQQISSEDLMERAASAVSCEIISKYMPSQRIVVFAGPGNNGGDALAIARMLIEQGYRRVEVFLFNVAEKLSHDCEIQRQKLITIDDVDFTEVKQQFSPPYLGKSDVVVDGLFGAGINKPMLGGFISVARLINESGAYVISIDVPSGLFGEWNSDNIKRNIVHANETYVFQFPRLSFFFQENEEIVGQWKLLDIDLDPKAIASHESDICLVEPRNIRYALKPRKVFSAKRDYGSALIFAGSAGMMGAAILCARAVLKTGAGLATVHSAACGLPILQTAVPEAMFEPDRNEHFVSDMTIHHDHQAVAIGPGLGSNDQTIDALEKMLLSGVSKLVLDADALNCIAKRPALLTMLPARTIITPHIGEFDRLFGEQDGSEARLKTAIEMARRYNIIIVLKGHHTMTVRPTGRIFINQTGNSGMATAGSGDVLTGAIASFMAQGYEPEYASLMGVYFHGLAGDLAAQDLGEYGMTSGDIANYLGRAIKSLVDR